MDGIEKESEAIGLTSGQALHRQKPWLETIKNFGLVLVGFSIGFLLIFTLGHKSSVGRPLIAEAPLKFLVIGDWGREGTNNQSLVADAMGVIAEQLNVNFVISTGDNFYESGLSSLDDPTFERSFTRIYTARSLQTLWYAVLGNHDYVQIAALQTNPALKLRDPRWHCERNYSFRRTVCPIPGGNCNATAEFFFIDTNVFVNAHWGVLNFTGLNSQEKEVEAILKNLRLSLSSSNATWKLVIGHHPIRSVGVHGDTLELVQSLLPLLEEHKVDLYINGHDHALELIKRLDSSIPLITSGAGSQCYREQRETNPEDGLLFGYNRQGFVSMGISPSFLHVDFHDLQGSVLHSYHLSKDFKL